MKSYTQQPITDFEDNSISLKASLLLASQHKNKKFHCSQPNFSTFDNVEKQLTLSRFQYIQEVGEGSFSTACLVRDSISGYQVVLKQINMQKMRKSGMLQSVRNEIKIQTSLDHPNILKCYASFSEGHNIYLILEWASRGNLSQKLPYSQSQAAEYMAQIVSGINYLHDNNIIHRDIKPQNILLASDNTIKISDFNLAVQLGYGQDLYRKSVVGTPAYMSPQSNRRKQYGKDVDMWAVGVLAYELATGQIPWVQKMLNHRREQSLAAVINRGEYTLREDITEELRSFVRELLKVDKIERMTVGEAMDHEWLKQGVAKIRGEIERSER